MSLAAVLAHGATGVLDELVAFGLPLVILLALYLWSSRTPKGGRRK